MKKLLVIMFTLTLILATSSAFAFLDYYEDNSVNANAEATATGVGIGIGFGGDAYSSSWSEGGNATIRNSGNSDVDVDNFNFDYNNVEVDTRDTNINLNSDYQGQHQYMGSQKNKQTTVITIEDQRQMTSIPGPMVAPDQLAPAPQAGHHNAEFFFPYQATRSQLKDMDIREGWMWGTKTRVARLTTKRLEKSNTISGILANSLANGALAGHFGHSDLVGIVTVRGSTKVIGYECVAHALIKAMDLGGKHYSVRSYGIETRARSFNLGLGGTTTMQTIYGTVDQYQAGGSGGTGVSMGSATIKVRPFVTILVYR